MRTCQNVKELFEKCAQGIYANAIKWREGGKYNLFASERLRELLSKYVSVYVYNKSR